MKEKYQNWVTSCRLAADQGAGNIDDLRALADSLQSLADMPDDEPADFESISDLPCGRTRMVTKENRDWWQGNYFVEHANRVLRDLQLAHAEKELAAKDARIESLQKIIRMQNGESVTLTEPLDVRDFGAIADQPKRPILADQPMTHDQLDCILDLIRAAVDEPTNYRRWNDCVVSATKLLVGE